jgi:hypothetical protein
MPIPRKRECQCSKDANTNREGMLMEQGCQYRGVLYQGSRDANTNREGILMPRSAIPMEQGCQYQWRGDADAKCYQITMPVTQQQSVRLANQCERRVWKLFQDKSTVGRTSNLL